jgi:hypothetical protein
VEYVEALRSQGRPLHTRIGEFGELQSRAGVMNASCHCPRGAQSQYIEVDVNVSLEMRHLISQVAA